VTECVFHIGAGKCGSSSLQAHLAANPHPVDSDGRRYEYVCIKRGGRLQRGEVAKAAGKRSPFGYSASVGLRHFFAPETVRALRNEFHRLAAEGVVPIVSFEGWINVGDRFSEWKVLEALELNPRVIAFIRPQIPWLNSSWWQWGAWSEKGFDAWLERWKTRGLWAKAFEAWRRLPNVQNVNFFTTSTDVVTRFHDWIGAPLESEPVRANATLDGTLLRFLQRHPELRTGDRGSAVDFILARHLAASDKPAPWVLPMERVCELMAYYEADNKRLLELVDADMRREIENDDAWWRPERFADRPVEPPEAVELPVEEIEDLTWRALLAIPGMGKIGFRGGRDE